jgi:hypothetical protein
VLLRKFPLDGLEQVTIEDRRMLRWTNLALEDHLADVEPIVQELGEGASGEGNAANGPPIREVTDLGDDPALPKVGQQQADTAEFEVVLEDRADAIGLLLFDDELLVTSDFGLLALWRVLGCRRGLARFH